MTDPISFTSATPRFALPFLFAGQAQKEFFVNEALARVDALLHPAIEGELNAPPATPSDGQSWLVGAAPGGEWSDHAGEIASRQAGGWLYAIPQIGMQVYDKTTGSMAFFDGGWQRAAPVTAPTGGSTIDTEARDAIAALVAALISANILS